MAGITDATHAEYADAEGTFIIDAIACAMPIAGRPALAGSLAVRLAPGSLAARVAGADEVAAEFFCNYALNPAYREPLEAAGLRFTGFDADGEPRVAELPGSVHPFYLATAFLPQCASTAERPDPFTLAFVRAASRVGAPAAGR